MRLLKVLVASLAFGLFSANAALAGLIGVAYEDAIAVDGVAQTKGFVGLNWTLGGSPTPELVLGVAHGQTLADGTVQGAKAGVYFDVASGFALDKAKLTGLYGTSDVQAELGFGYNFQSGAVFGVAGANGSYLNAGVDVYAGMEIEAFFAAHSIGVFDDSGYTCDGVTPPVGPFWGAPVLVGEECMFTENIFIQLPPQN